MTSSIFKAYEDNSSNNLAVNKLSLEKSKKFARDVTMEIMVLDLWCQPCKVGELRGLWIQTFNYSGRCCIPGAKRLLIIVISLKKNLFMYF